jgi:tRNA/rRNA methyltransferase
MEKAAETPPVIILVAPQMGENIGATARAMLNFGLTEMRIVTPRDGWPNQAAIDMAAGAFDIMPPPQIYGSLADAIGDLHFTLATTARPRHMISQVYSPREGIKQMADQYRAQPAGAFKAGLVFGRERSGLENDEIVLSQGIISIPSNPAFSSFNLGQSVLLLAYEWFLSQMSADVAAHRYHTGDTGPAPQSQIEALWSRLETALDDGAFFREPDLKFTMARNIRNMLSRAQITEQEARTFHGIISALEGKKPPLTPKSARNKKAAE